MRQNGSERMGAGGVRFRGHRPGMTMIELIVVLAILALMSAIAIPTFARLGYFSRNDLQATARELHSMLKAAKIYAATYRVNTAVAYSVVPVIDSITGATVEIIDAAALVYKFPQDIKNLTTFHDQFQDQDDSNKDKDDFVPITASLTGAFFRSTKQDTCVLIQGPSNYDLKRTLNTVRIYRVEPQLSENNELRFDAYPVETLPAYRDKYRDKFFAHIFKPGGQVIVSDPSLPERFRMLVGYRPDRSTTERYVDETRTQLRVETIELSQNTGRVQLVQE
ncbi:MAG TPA: prepilin-type N-terminal cleavage/methylation domain-containing protein [Candidatus Hydrogenedentes bacterium]|nr:prepilin-type N-terminal cleavage/methylation domain-containing protein [Candidatus Hydrogenedentota bacterium]